MSNRKKNHHFVPDAYLNKWRKNDTLFALAIDSLKPFNPGRSGAGAENKFYSFEFDPKVIDLLNYTFKKRADENNPGNIYQTMLFFIKMMKDFDYPNKESNLFEDLFEKIEKGIKYALDSIFTGEIQNTEIKSETFDSLVIFYFTQQMRTRKIRRQLSDRMGNIYANHSPLSVKQKDDYLKIFLLIESLATALKVINLGCILRIRHAKYGEKFIISDAPVLQTCGQVTDIKGVSGRMPLSPCYIMELDTIGFGFKSVTSGIISNSEVELVNMQMISNTDRNVYFSSANHRQKYADRLRLMRLQSGI